MHFAVALPFWGLAALAFVPVLVAWWTYSRLLVPVSRARRGVLVALRAVALGLIIACLLRPVRIVPPVESREMIVPILIDASRSMAIADESGEARIDAATDLVDRELTPALSRFTT